MKTLFKVLVLAMILASTFACKWNPYPENWKPVRQEQTLRGSAMIGDQLFQFDAQIHVPKPQHGGPYPAFPPNDGVGGHDQWAAWSNGLFRPARPS